MYALVVGVVVLLVVGVAVGVVGLLVVGVAVGVVGLLVVVVVVGVVVGVLVEVTVGVSVGVLILRKHAWVLAVVLEVLMQKWQTASVFVASACSKVIVEPGAVLFK